MNEIRPGQPVLTARLPMPVTAMPLIGDLVERVYGTGETMMRFEDDQITITAPADGFGPRKQGGKRPDRPKDTDGQVTAAELADGRFVMTMEDAEERIMLLVHAQRQWFETLGGVNYIEAGIGSKGQEPEFTFILQRRAGKTAHELRVEAEARAESAEVRLREIGQLLAAGDAQAAQELVSALVID